MLDTFAHTDFPAADLTGRLPGTVTVVIPARNCAGTIEATVAEIDDLSEAGLVDQILVVDADSPDGTADAARRAGAEVISENDLAPEFGTVLGKGDAMWRSLRAVRGDIVVFVDGDVADFGSHYVTGLLGPFRVDGSERDASRGFVKGRYRRPFRHQGKETPRGGGRVTELTARPLLDAMVPELALFDQPLAGEVAVRRDLLDEIEFVTGYGVEIAMLLRLWDRIGIERMAQVDLGTKRNSHQSLAALGNMAAEVIAALAHTLDSLDRPELGALRRVPEAATGLTVRPSWSSVPAGTAPDPAAQ